MYGILFGFVGIQTETVQPPNVNGHAQGPAHVHFLNGNSSSMSPIPPVDSALDLLEQIKALQQLANRYHGTALKYQKEFQRSEEKVAELAKQLQETQVEDREMIDFLQAEKSTLAESLAETEAEVGTCLVLPTN